MQQQKKLYETIGKGHTGTGLLLENDGYISLDSPENKIIKESIDAFKNGDANELPRPFVVSAVFQKYGIENANGRVYPEAILKRAVEDFQKLVKDRRAVGECYTPDVLCLTEDGWKELSEVKVGDKVLSLNPTTKEIEIATVINKIHREHNGKMIRINSRSINDLVTPGHKFPVYKYNKFTNFYTALNLLNKEIDGQNNSIIYCNGKWNCVGEEIMVIEGIKTPTKQCLQFHPNCQEDLKLQMSTFMKFMGIYLSEGDITKNTNAIRIHQKKAEVCEQIEEMLNDLGLPYSISIRKCDNKRVFTICDPRLKKYLEPLGNCYTKYIPFKLKNQSKENLRNLYDWFVLGDGRIRGDKRNKKKYLTDDVFSTSKQLILDLNEIQLKIGYHGIYHVEVRDNDRLIEGRLIEGKNAHPLHFSFRSLTENISMDERCFKISEEEYNGIVECIELDKNHTWYVMSNGKCHWTGNCEHPESSNLNSERICLLITELHWIGHTLVGKMEIPISEGFRKYGVCSTLADRCAQWLISGIKLGVSSRALGSVKQEYGKLMVGEDLEILTFDLVCTPSTPNAFITFDEKDLAPYIQEDVHKDGEMINETKTDKFSKFDQWLKD